MGREAVRLRLAGQEEDGHGEGRTAVGKEYPMQERWPLFLRTPKEDVGLVRWEMDYEFPGIL